MAFTKKGKIMKLTRPQELCLIGALLYGACPIVFDATASSLRKGGMLTTDNLGNLVLTHSGRMKAKAALQRLSNLKRAKA